MALPTSQNAELTTPIAPLPAETTTSTTTPTTTTAQPLPPPILTTPRLLIRPLHAQDAPSATQAANTPLIAKYMTHAFPSPYLLSHAESWISLATESPPIKFHICPLSSPSVVIGGIGLKPGSDLNSHAAEVGYWIAEKYWGQGMMTEALAGFTDWVFSKRGDVYKRLWAGVLSGNEVSVRCLEKCGYQFEGRLKGHCVDCVGETRDLIVLGLTREDWDASRNGKGGEKGRNEQ